jgi:hypothetical protein
MLQGYASSAAVTSQKVAETGGATNNKRWEAFAAARTPLSAFLAHRRPLAAGGQNISTQEWFSLSRPAPSAT